MAKTNGDVLTPVASILVAVAGFFVSLYDFFVLKGRTMSQLDPLGVAVLVAGFAFQLVAIRALGKEYSFRVRTTKEQTLVQSGPYRLVRHPAYLASILEYFSMPLMLYSGYGVLVVLPIVPILLRRIVIEEKAMLLRFGDEYRAYAKRVKRLIPFVF
jgi:protein-S-isoprenylcysteine O-methyltransferase Ste14